MIVLNLVLIGLVITLEPLPLTAFILILSSKGGVRKGAAFIFGWLLSLAIAFTVLVTGNNPPKPSTAPSLAALAAKLAIGVGLTVIAIRQYKKMGKPKPPKKPPRWQTGIDNMTPWYAIGLGPLTQPWALIAAGVSVIVMHGRSQPGAVPSRHTERRQCARCSMPALITLRDEERSTSVSRSPTICGYRGLLRDTEVVPDLPVLRSQLLPVVRGVPRWSCA